MPNQFYPMSHEDAVNLIAVLNAFAPGLVTTTQRGFLAPDAEAIANGFIKLATSSNKGLMSAAFAAMLENPASIIFADNASTRSAAYHNSAPYRGKNLGNALTPAQAAQIAARTYDGMWLGDHWVINGHTHTIASFEPYYNVGDGGNGIPVVQRGHLGIVSDGGWAHAWNSGSGGTSGGYVNLADGTIRKYIKDTVQPAIQADFGSTHVLAYRALYPTTYNTSGVATGWAWADAMTELLNEVEVYGCQVWASSAFEVGHSARQLDLFRVMPNFKFNRASWWLRSVSSATGACLVGGSGGASDLGASNLYGVRPLSLIA